MTTDEPASASRDRALLQISDVSSLTSLPVQTLRYYHSEGLLVPADVDEHTGYRGYTFDQVHQAVTVTTLRQSGLSIRDILAVLEAPDRLPAVLEKQSAVLQRRRDQEDAALAQAWELTRGWPRLDEQRTPAVTALALRLPGVAADGTDQVIPDHVHAAARRLRHRLVDEQLEPAGPPWCEQVLDTAADKRKLQTPPGPDWRVAVPVDAVPDPGTRLPDGVQVIQVEPRRSAVVSFSGRPRMITFAAALERITTTALERGLVPDLGHLRYLLRDDASVALAVRLSEAESDLGEDGPIP